MLPKMRATKLGNYDNIVLSILGSPFRTSLGSGGFGTVITTDDYPDYALKISHGLNVCPEWKHEYNIQHRIYDGYDSTRKSVRVVKPLQFANIEGGRCYILMQRVCSPEDKDNITAVHTLLGEIYKDETHGKRGRFVGQEFLKDYIDLERVAVDLGIFIATVHFKLGLDGLDLEYILGKRCGAGDKKYWINVIDFGMVGPYDLQRAVGSIESVPYFPLLSTCEYYDCTPEQVEYNRKLSELFANAYISEAEKYGMGDDAVTIIELVQ